MRTLLEMKPSNPASCFVSGSDTEEYVFQPGALLHYAIVHSTGVVRASLLLMADDEAHVRALLEGYCVFTDACESRYQRRHAFSGGRSAKDIRKALAGDAEWRIDIGLAATNQFYKIGWAGNDTL